LVPTQLQELRERAKSIRQPIENGGFSKTILFPQESAEEFEALLRGLQNESGQPVLGSDFYNYMPGAGAQNCMLFTRTNKNNLSSGFAAVATGCVSYYGNSALVTWLNVTFDTESQPVASLYGHYKFTGNVVNLSDPQSSYGLRGGGGFFNGAPTTTPVVSTAF
jgi:hypothetical protein